MVRTTTVGSTLEHVKSKLVDAEGRIVPVGKEGEVCARGHLIMVGYWNEAKKTAELGRTDLHPTCPTF